MSKYKYSRKKIVKWLSNLDLEWLKDDLLATKEDKCYLNRYESKIVQLPKPFPIEPLLVEGSGDEINKIVLAERINEIIKYLKHDPH